VCGVSSRSASAIPSSSASPLSVGDRHRLGDVVVDVEPLERLAAVFGVRVEAGHDDHLRVERRLFLEDAAHLAAVELRHERVGENEIRPVRAGDLETVLAVGGVDEAVSKV
jgi:hypothetical protein